MQKLAADSGLDGEGKKNSSVDRVYLAMEGHKPVIKRFPLSNNLVYMLTNRLYTDVVRTLHTLIKV